jgi:hypothetical protein
VLAGCVGALYLATRERPDLVNEGHVGARQVFRFGNFVELELLGAGTVFEWHGYNTQGGSILHPPWQELTADDGQHRHVITDRDVGNRELSVDGTIVPLDPKRQRVQLRMGQRPTLTDRVPTEPVLTLRRSASR